VGTAGCGIEGWDGGEQGLRHARAEASLQPDWRKAVAGQGGWGQFADSRGVRVSTCPCYIEEKGRWRLSRYCLTPPITTARTR
jgi:hypothetical protein